MVCLGLVATSVTSKEREKAKLVYQASFFEGGLVIFPKNEEAWAFDSLGWTGRATAQNQVEKAAKTTGYSFAEAHAFAQQSVSAIISAPPILPLKTTAEAKADVISKAVENEITEWKENGLSISIPVTAAAHGKTGNFETTASVEVIDFRLQTQS